MTNRFAAVRKDPIGNSGPVLAEVTALVGTGKFAEGPVGEAAEAPVEIVADWFVEG